MLSLRGRRGEYGTGMIRCAVLGRGCDGSREEGGGEEGGRSSCAFFLLGELDICRLSDKHNLN